MCHLERAWIVLGNTWKLIICFAVIVEQSLAVYLTVAQVDVCGDCMMLSSK